MTLIQNKTKRYSMKIKIEKLQHVSFYDVATVDS